MKNVPRFLLLLMMGLATGVHAASWRQVPVPGADVDDLVVLGNGLLYAGTNNGVYRSADGGDTWAPAQTDAPSRTFARLHAVNGDPQKLAALVVDETVQGWIVLAASRDGGATWQITRGDPRFSLSGSFASHPSLPGVVLFSSPGITVRSEDGGLTWADLGSTLAKKDIFAIRDRPGRFVATTYYYDRLLESNDGGLSWTVLAMQPMLPVGDYLSFEQDPRQPAVLYFASYRTGGQSGASGSIDTNTGVVTLFSDTCGCSHVRVVPDPHRPGRLVAPSVAFDPDTFAALGRPLRESLDGGATWRELGRLPRKLDDDYRWYFDPSDLSRVYLPTGGAGVYRSDDGGRSFTPRYSGMNAGVVTNLSVDPTDPSEFLVTRRLLPMLHTGDGGATFSRVAVNFYSDLPYEDRSRIARSWTDPKILIGFDDGSFHRSQDGGRTWTRLTSDYPFADVWTTAIQFTGAGDDKLAVLAQRRDDFARQVYWSDDGGHSWTSTLLGSGTFANRLGSGGVDGSPVFVRTESYDSVRGPLWVADRFDGAFRLIPDPDPSQFLSWIRSAPDPNDTWRMLAISKDSSTSARPRQVWETLDGGATWHNLGSSDFVTGIAYAGVPVIDACDGRTIWEGKTGQVSRDNGRSFRRTDTGIPSYLRNVQAICHQTRSHVFATTAEGIVIREPEASDTLLKAGHDP